MPPSRPPKPVAGNFLLQAMQGLTYPLESLKFLGRERLWGYAIVPIVINAAVFGALVAVGVLSVRPLLESFSVWLSGVESQSAVLGVLVSIAVVIVWVLVFVLLLGASGVVILLVGQALASPFLDVLSEKVETRVLEAPEVPFGLVRMLKSLLVSMGDLVGGLVYLVLIQVPIVLVGFIPVVGTAPAAIASFVATALLVAHQFTGLPLARQLVSYRQRWRVLWKNKWLGLGFGTTSMLFLLVPGLNLVLLPLAAVGGTLLYCDLKAANRL